MPRQRTCLPPLTTQLSRETLLIACLTVSGCSFFDDDGNNSTEPGLQGGTPTGASSELANDALQPPPNVELELNTAPGTLEFFWTPNDAYANYSLIATNRVTDEALLIASDLTGINQYSKAISMLTFDWAHTSITLQACDSENDCVSSLPLDIGPYASAGLQRLATNSGTVANRFGQSTAIIDNGLLLAITEPGASQAHLYSNFNQQQNFEQTLTMDRSTDDHLHVLRVALSATGDSAALASWSAAEQLQLHIFDRLGPTWIETDTLTPTLPSSAVPGGLWQGSSLQIVMAEDGNSVLVGLQGRDAVGNLMDDVVYHISRINFNWMEPVALPAMDNTNRMPSLSASADLRTVHLLTAKTSGELSLHHVTHHATGWSHSAIEALPSIPATLDARVQSNSIGNGAMVGAWEVSSTIGRSPVLWKLDCTDSSCSNWRVDGSIRLPPTKNFDAELKLKADGDHQTALLGWQSGSDSVLSVLNRDESTWTETLPLPYLANTLSGTRFVSDLSISRIGTTAVITSLTPMPLGPASEPTHAIILE